MADLAPPDDLFAPPPDDVFNDAGPTTMRNPAVPHPPPAQQPQSLWRSYLDAMSRADPMERAGAVTGGVIGGAVGGIPGAMIGSGIGRAAGKSPPMPPHYLDSLQAQEMPQMHKADMEGALYDAATQGVVGKLMQGAGMVAAKAGFPRVAGFLGARPPQQAVSETIPSEVKGMSTTALKNLDAASPLGPGAVQDLSKAHRLVATRDIDAALEAGRAGKIVPEISERMAGRVEPLAEATAKFTGVLKNELPAEQQAMSAAWEPMNNGYLRRVAMEPPESPNLFQRAFTDTPAVPEAAGNKAIMEARSQMVQKALPQRLDADAIDAAGKGLSKSAARGVKPVDAPQLAADRAGYTKFAGPYVNRSGSPISQTVPQRVSQLLAPEYLQGNRALQVLGAELSNRGQETLSPEIAKQLAGGDIYRASPMSQADVEALRAFLSALSRPKSQP